MEEEVLKGNGKGFITSPADIDPREPIKLRDAEVTPEHRKAFEDLCSESVTIFSKDSADLGKDPTPENGYTYKGQPSHYPETIHFSS